MKPIDIVTKYYGYTSFRPGQKLVIETILSHRDCLAIMPTGAGKSLCFQVPSLMLPGITLIISPLISLMKDQVDALVDQEIPATFINSQCSVEELRQRFSQIRRGHIKLVYISPERLQNEFFSSFIQDMDISMVVIDEAHCVSQWGHDFRPSYCAIGDWVQSLDTRPIVAAFTATATEKVKTDMLQLLGLQKPRVFVGGFDRPNLYFSVLTDVDRTRYVVHYVTTHAGESGIIYAATRKEVDRLYKELKKYGVSVGKYHAGMSDSARKEAQEGFTFDTISVMVATNAFGMGIDKSNVRYIIHYQMPKNMESYYQEAGRAGRDGEAGECILLFNRQDIVIQKFLIENSVHSMEQKRREFDKLHAMIDYCETKGCLRRFILSYFGEHPQWKKCDRCGNCDKKMEEIDTTNIVAPICYCVYELGNHFGLTMVCDILRGNRTTRIAQYGFDGKTSFGRLSQYSNIELHNLVRQAIYDGFLSQSDGKYPILSVTLKGREVLTGQRRAIQEVAVKAEPAKRLATSRAVTAAVGAKEKNRPLFEALRQLRFSLSQKAHIPPFVIFSDATLWELAARRPQSKEALMDVKGIGSFKREKYGDAFIQAIQDFIKQE